MSKMNKDILSGLNNHDYKLIDHEAGTEEVIDEDSFVTIILDYYEAEIAKGRKIRHYAEVKHSYTFVEYWNEIVDKIMTADGEKPRLEVIPIFNAEKAKAQIDRINKIDAKSKIDQTRVTFDISNVVYEKVNGIAFWTGKTKKEILNTLLADAIIDYEEKHGDTMLPPDFHKSNDY